MADLQAHNTSQCDVLPLMKEKLRLPNSNDEYYLKVFIYMQCWNKTSTHPTRPRWSSGREAGSHICTSEEDSRQQRYQASCSWWRNKKRIILLFLWSVRSDFVPKSGIALPSRKNGRLPWASQCKVWQWPRPFWDACTFTSFNDQIAERESNRSRHQMSWNVYIVIVCFVILIKMYKVTTN